MISQTINPSTTGTEPMIVMQSVEKVFWQFSGLVRHQPGGPRRREDRPVRTIRFGKSTLVRCINHLENYPEGSHPDRGVYLDNNPKTIDMVRREVGMVFQQFNLFPHLTVMQNCTLAPIRVRRLSKADAEATARRLLARVQILDQAEKYPAQLSGGQQQARLPSPCALHGAKVMLFDEPTSALDPEMVKEVLDTMIDWPTTE